MESSRKMEDILDAFQTTYLGRRKLRAWLQTPQGLNIVCDIVSEEMDAVQKAEYLPAASGVSMLAQVGKYSVIVLLNPKTFISLSQKH
jgi:hypothetical protein